MAWFKWLETPEQTAARKADEAEWKSRGAAHDRFERQKERGWWITRWLDGS